MAITGLYNNSTLVINEKTWSAKDAMGGETYSLTPRHSGTLNCRVEEVNGEERINLGIDSGIWTLRIFCSPTFQVHQQDVIEVTYNNEDLVMEVHLPDWLARTSAFHHYELIVADFQNQSGHNS